MNTILTSSQPTLNQVFLCPICSSMFNHNINLPLALPCGHVICKQCLISSTQNVALTDTFKCLIDKQPFNMSIASLKSCQAILDNLPHVDTYHQHESPQKQFVCKAHPTKRIKYICEYDNEVFCSSCVNSHNKHPHVLCNFIPQKEHLVNEIALIKKRVQDKKTELNNNNKLLNETRNTLYDKTKDEITKLNNEIDNIIQMFEKCKTLYEEKIKNMLKYQLEEINESKLAINQQLITLNELDELINDYNKVLLSNGLIYEHIIDNKNKIFTQWESFLKQQSNSLSSVYIANDIHYVINNITYPKVNIRKIDVVNMFEFNAESTREQIVTKENNNVNSNITTQISSNNGCCNNYFNFNSARNNSRIKMRKGSDPTTKSNNRNYPFDSKNEDKPVILNNVPQINNSPYLDNNNKNIKTTKTHASVHRSNNSNSNLNSNSNSTKTKSNSNSRKSVSSKNRDTHIVITN